MRSVLRTATPGCAVCGDGVYDTRPQRRVCRVSRSTEPRSPFPPSRLSGGKRRIALALPASATVGCKPLPKSRSSGRVRGVSAKFGQPVFALVRDSCLLGAAAFGLARVGTCAAQF